MSIANAQLTKNYDRAAWFYESASALFSAGQIRASKKYTVAQLNRGDKVIFLGVGTGEEAVLAAQRGARVTCIDISARMLDRLQRRLAKRNLSAEIICDDAFQHGRFGYYDACAANYFLNVFRLDDMRRMIKHASGLLRPGGKFLVADVALAQGGLLSRAFNICYLKSAMTLFWSLGLVPLHRNYDYAKYFSDVGLCTDHVRYFKLFKGGPVVFQSLVAKKCES